MRPVTITTGCQPDTRISGRRPVSGKSLWGRRLGLIVSWLASLGPGARRSLRNRKGECQDSASGVVLAQSGLFLDVRPRFVSAMRSVSAARSSDIPDFGRFPREWKRVFRSCPSLPGFHCGT